MKSIFHVFSGFVFAVLACLPIEAALAENGCPNGYEPWKIPVESSSDCMAIPDYGDNEPQGPMWETRWGAIAIGDGGVGTASNVGSERQAKNEAVKQCKKAAGLQGSTCEVLTYHNQCAAVAWGLTGYVIQTAADLSTASSLALERCSIKHDDCQIFYSDCSLPKQVN